MSSEIRKLKKDNHRKFMLGFFKDEPKNETLELNGFVLFKHWDGNCKRWTVDLFTPESYQTMKEHAWNSIQEKKLF